MRICIYEDRHARGFDPLTLTRPVADLLCGLTTLGEKQVRHFAATSVGHLCRPAVADIVRSRDPLTPVNDPIWLRSASTVLVNARWLPQRDCRRGITSLFAEGSYIGTANGEIAYAVLDARLLAAVSPATLEDCLDDWLQSLPTRDAGGTVVERPWDLIDLNSSQIACDYETDSDPSIAGFHPTGFAHVGRTDQFFIHPTAKIDPMVVADTTRGPVSIGPGAVVQAFTRLEGPCAVGAGSVIQAGTRIRGGTTIGPQCRVGGEIECSILLGYANKYHDGFLGHSYLGEWVNLAAGTHTSDLRCDYQPVSVPVGGEEVPTGRMKIGAIVGDHAKTGLGVLLNCGTVVGPFAQVLPTGEFAPRELPAFTRAGPGGLKELTDVNRVLATGETVMRRRGRVLTPALEAAYRAIASGHREPDATPVLPLRRTA